MSFLWGNRIAFTQDGFKRHGTCWPQPGALVVFGNFVCPLGFRYHLMYSFVLSWTMCTSEWRSMCLHIKMHTPSNHWFLCLGYTLLVPGTTLTAFSFKRFSQFQIFTHTFGVGSQQTDPLMWWKSQLTSWSLKIILLYKPITSLCFFSLPTALGQIMLYVDGMNGVINHSETIQWLYTLVGSKVRHFFFFFWNILFNLQIIAFLFKSSLKCFCKEQSYSALLKSCLGINDD